LKKENEMAAIESIVFQPEGMEYAQGQAEYLRIPAQKVRLVAGHGIAGDQKAGHHPDRQLNLLSCAWLESAAAKGYKTGPGQFGEQIIINGLAVEMLQPGTRLQVGDSACIEITKTRSGCDRLELAQGLSIKGLGPLGVLAKVINSGEIAVGDPVTILETVA
jgi:MOSC domain-containing protein YiiM